MNIYDPSYLTSHLKLTIQQSINYISIAVLDNGHVINLASSLSQHGFTPPQRQLETCRVSHPE